MKKLGLEDHPDWQHLREDIEAHTLHCYGKLLDMSEKLSRTLDEVGAGYITGRADTCFIATCRRLLMSLQSSSAATLTN
jgi:hypothetical protein